jgi:hypothetical protein
MECSQARIQGFHELGRVLLEHFKDLHRRVLFGKIAQDMDVILDTTDRDGMTFETLENARLVSPQSRANGFVQPRMTLFRRANDVDAQEMQ